MPHAIEELSKNTSSIKKKLKNELIKQEYEMKREFANPRKNN